jgi:hypothetical protein
MFLVIWATAFVTFASFFVTGLSWGGAALGGKVEDGKYFLGEHGKFREVGRGYYGVSAALSAIWPPALVLGVSQMRGVFPATPDTRKLFLVITIFSSLIAAAFSITSLICLWRAFT